MCDADDVGRVVCIAMMDGLSWVPRRGSEVTAWLVDLAWPSLIMPYYGMRFAAFPSSEDKSRDQLRCLIYGLCLRTRRLGMLTRYVILEKKRNDMCLGH